MNRYRRKIRMALLARMSLVLSFACVALASQCKAQANQPPQPPANFILLLPDNFSGWVCVDFETPGAPPLPQEADALVIRPRPEEVLATSTKSPIGLHPAAWYEAGGKRKPLPQGVTTRQELSRGGPREATQRQCVFVGTEDQSDAATDPPGFEHSSEKSEVIPAEERQALEALYNATGGDKWIHRVAWMGPRGTECKWHGIYCQSLDSGATVVGLRLYDNNLVGSIPDELGQLTNLASLDLGRNKLKGPVPDSIGRLKDLDDLALFENHFSGRLPDPLMQRWLAGSLTVIADGDLLTGVSEVDYESLAPALLCASHRVIFRADATAISYTERCKPAPNDRSTFCEVKRGRIAEGEFAMLGLLAEKNAFFQLKPSYERTITHGTFENTRITRAGKVYAVSNYASSGPFELWTIQRAIDGTAANIYWEPPTSQLKCPTW